MGFFDKIQDAWNSFTGGGYEDEYDDIQYNQYNDYRQSAYSDVNMTSSAHDYSYYEQPVQPSEPVQTENNIKSVTQSVVCEIAMVKPENMESIREAADHLIKNRAVVLSLKDTEPSLARRWLDYLGGATYAVDGKLNRIAPFTYLLTPKGVDLVAGFETEI